VIKLALIFRYRWQEKKELERKDLANLDIRFKVHTISGP